MSLLSDEHGVVELNTNSTDKPRAWFRTRINKNSNNEVRNLFRSTIEALIKEFNLTEKESAKLNTAMRWNDYDKGRPLTARRINEVSKEIWNHLTQSFKNNELTVDGKAVGDLTDLQKFVFKNGTFPTLREEVKDSNIFGTGNTSINSVEENDVGGFDRTSVVEKQTGKLGTGKPTSGKVHTAPINNNVIKNDEDDDIDEKKKDNGSQNGTVKPSSGIITQTANFKDKLAMFNKQN